MATGNARPASDIDIGVCVDRRYDLFSFRLIAQEEIDRRLKERRSCDLVILNNAPTVLRYEIIKNGKVLKEDKPKRIQFETNALREYLDTEWMRSVHISSLKMSFRKEHPGGQ